MRRSIVLAVVFALLAAGCGGGSKSAKPSSTTGGAAKLPVCPLDALQSAKKPVDITYWHALTVANEQELKKLTAQFNDSQHDVHVSLSGAPSYPDNLTRLRAGLGTRALPDLYQGEDVELQTMIDSGAVMPAAACLKADHASTTDLVPRVVAYYSVTGVLYPMPFNDSNPVLYYNKVAFQKAGLDPGKPPTTLDEVKADAAKIVQSGAAKYGIALKTDSWLIEHWLAKANQTLVNNGNGRTARATKVTFDTPTTVALFTWIHDMVSSKLALSTGASDFNHYIAVGNGTAAMTIDTSAALGTIFQRLAAGEYQGVHVGTAAMPGLANSTGGVLVGGAANYIINRSSPAKQAAAYEFAKFLAQPQTQSDWAAATGYVPVSRGATTLKPLTDKWIAQPGFKVAFDQLLQGVTSDATAGPVIGAYGAAGEGVRGALIDAMSRVLTQNLAPADAVRQAATGADSAIAEYNRRVG
jgi:sn-glycerol 3-phosphate transport system substrate-binding protein